MGKSQHRHLTTPVKESDQIRGPATAPVTLVMYGDYECPYTALAQSAVADLRQRLGDRLCFVFRYFPLTHEHPHAWHAALVAGSAEAQGKFWEMHEHLLANQQALDKAYLTQYARNVGLDMDRFQREMSAEAHADRIREDIESGQASGVKGTPTFFVNGMRLPSPTDLTNPSHMEALVSAIQSALSEPSADASEAGADSARDSAA